MREIAALLLGTLREAAGMRTELPTLHMSGIGRPGTGRTNVAMRLARILHLLGYVRKGHLVVAARDDIVAILAGCGDRMETFFRSDAGFHARIAHHLEFPDFSPAELLTIAEGIRAEQQNAFDRASRAAFAGCIAERMTPRQFASTRRRRDAADIRQSRVLREE